MPEILDKDFPGPKPEHRPGKSKKEILDAPHPFAKEYKQQQDQRDTRIQRTKDKVKREIATAPLRHKRNGKVHRDNRVHPEDKRKKHPGKRLSKFFERGIPCGKQMEQKIERRKRRIGENRHEVPDQRGLDIYKKAADVSDGNHFVKTPGDSQMDQRENSRNAKGREGRKLRGQGNPPLPIRAQHKENRRKESPRMGKAYPEDEIRYRRSPEKFLGNRPGFRSIKKRHVNGKDSAEKEHKPEQENLPVHPLPRK